jgi:hypothetical protein
VSSCTCPSVLGPHRLFFFSSAYSHKPRVALTPTAFAFLASLKTGFFSPWTTSSFLRLQSQNPGCTHPHCLRLPSLTQLSSVLGPHRLSRLQSPHPSCTHSLCLRFPSQKGGNLSRRPASLRALIGRGDSCHPMLQPKKRKTL